MGYRIAGILWAVIAVVAVRADEKLPVLKVGAQVYSNVNVTAVTATDVYFSSSKGVANAKLKNLEPEMQKHFHYDAAKAEAVAKKQEAASASLSRSKKPITEEMVDRKNAKELMDGALEQVKAIVNQPVKQIPSTPSMEVANFSPGWFHDGAIKPDFRSVDIRSTQDLLYSKHPYVTSDLTPGVAFIGSDVEFNAMTKYFYVDRTLPKKKLTEEEMVEVNRLYRVIAKCEDKMQEPADVVAETVAANKKPLMIGAVALLLVFLPIRFLMSRGTA